MKENNGPMFENEKGYSNGVPQKGDPSIPKERDLDTLITHFEEARDRTSFLSDSIFCGDYDRHLVHLRASEVAQVLDRMRRLKREALECWDILANTLERRKDTRNERV